MALGVADGVGSNEFAAAIPGVAVVTILPDCFELIA